MKPSTKKIQLTPEDVDFIKNILRQGSVKWPGRAECLKLARKRVLEKYSKDGKPVYKYHWQCAICRNWRRNEKEMEVDHIIEIGSYAGDLHDYALRMFCGQDNLQCVCTVCHMKKTNAYNSANNKWVRKK